MQVIRLETKIAAPVERCFLLSLSIDLHVKSTAHTSERAVAGVTHGIIGAGERVTWRGRHFGVMLTHESVIAAYRAPTHFQDRMVRGAFESFAHDHDFIDGGDGTTLMRDELRLEAPLGALGRVAEVLFLRRHLRGFLEERNAVIRAVAEGPESGWRAFLERAASGPAMPLAGAV